MYMNSFAVPFDGWQAMAITMGVRWVTTCVSYTLWTSEAILAALLPL